MSFKKKRTRSLKVGSLAAKLNLRHWFIGILQKKARA